METTSKKPPYCIRHIVFAILYWTDWCSTLHRFLFPLFNCFASLNTGSFIFPLLALCQFKHWIFYFVLLALCQFKHWIFYFLNCLCFASVINTGSFILHCSSCAACFRHRIFCISGFMAHFIFCTYFLHFCIQAKFLFQVHLVHPVIHV